MLSANFTKIVVRISEKIKKRSLLSVYISDLQKRGKNQYWKENSLFTINTHQLNR